MSAQNTKAIVCMGDLNLHRQQSTSGNGIPQGGKKEKFAIHPSHPPTSQLKTGCYGRRRYKVCMDSHSQNQANCKLNHVSS